VARVSRGGYYAWAALFDYIQIFYNREQTQAGLGHLSSFDYEAALVVA